MYEIALLSLDGDAMPLMKYICPTLLSNSLEETLLKSEQ
jgi:hypothetical protein